MYNHTQNNPEARNYQFNFVYNPRREPEIGKRTGKIMPKVKRMERRLPKINYELDMTVFSSQESFLKEVEENNQEIEDCMMIKNLNSETGDIQIQNKEKLNINVGLLPLKTMSPQKLQQIIRKSTKTQQRQMPRSIQNSVQKNVPNSNACQLNNIPHQKLNKNILSFENSFSNELSLMKVMNPNFLHHSFNFDISNIDEPSQEESQEMDDFQNLLISSSFIPEEAKEIEVQSNTPTPNITRLSHLTVDKLSQDELNKFIYVESNHPIITNCDESIKDSEENNLQIIHPQQSEIKVEEKKIKVKKARKRPRNASNLKKNEKQQHIHEIKHEDSSQDKALQGIQKPMLTDIHNIHSKMRIKRSPVRKQNKQVKSKNKKRNISTSGQNKQKNNRNKTIERKKKPQNKKQIQKVEKIVTIDQKDLLAQDQQNNQNLINKFTELKVDDSEQVSKDNIENLYPHKRSRLNTSFEKEDSQQKQKKKQLQQIKKLEQEQKKKKKRERKRELAKIRKQKKAQQKRQQKAKQDEQKQQIRQQKIEEEEEIKRSEKELVLELERLEDWKLKKSETYQAEQIRKIRELKKLELERLAEFEKELEMIKKRQAEEEQQKRLYEEAEKERQKEEELRKQQTENIQQEDKMATKQIKNEISIKKSTTKPHQRKKKYPTVKQLSSNKQQKPKRKCIKKNSSKAQQSLGRISQSSDASNRLVYDSDQFLCSSREVSEQIQRTKLQEINKSVVTRKNRRNKGKKSNDSFTENHTDSNGKQLKKLPSNQQSQIRNEQTLKHLQNQSFNNKLSHIFGENINTNVQFSDLNSNTNRLLLFAEMPTSDLMFQSITSNYKQLIIETSSSRKKFKIIDENEQVISPIKSRWIMPGHKPFKIVNKFKSSLYTFLKMTVVLE